MVVSMLQCTQVCPSRVVSVHVRCTVFVGCDAVYYVRHGYEWYIGRFTERI